MLPSTSSRDEVLPKSKCMGNDNNSSHNNNHRNKNSNTNGNTDNHIDIGGTAAPAQTATIRILLWLKYMSCIADVLAPSEAADDVTPYCLPSARSLRSSEPRRSRVRT